MILKKKKGRGKGGGETPKKVSLYNQINLTI